MKQGWGVSGAIFQSRRVGRRTQTLRFAWGAARAKFGLWRMAQRSAFVEKASDYIVVGAGSAGAVVAARPAAAGTDVTLIEAGAAAHQDAVKVPALYPTLMDSELDWGYRTLP